MWRSMSIAKKIYLCMGVVILGYSASMFNVIVGGEQSQKHLGDVSGVFFPASQHSQIALTFFEQQTKAYEDGVILGDKSALEAAQQKNEAVNDRLKAISKLDGLPQGEHQTVQEISQNLQAYTAQAKGIYTSMAAGNTEQQEKAAELSRRASELHGSLQALNERFSDDLQREISYVQSAIERHRIINIVGFIGVVAVAVLMMTLVFGGVMKRLRKTIDGLSRISEGDLTVRLDESQHDELSKLSQGFNGFVVRLQGIIGHLSNNSLQLGSSAELLKETAQQIASGSQDVASQSRTIASASEEMATTSKNIAENCLQASHSAQTTAATAKHGSAIVQNTVEGMHKIATHVQASARTVETLGVRSDQIGQIIGTIQDIADQINLLALNAAIEAARAGEQGRGFAVVAAEVRALAKRTTSATEGIRDMIRTIQVETKSAVAAMDEGVKEVEQGTQEAEKSGEALKAILDQINTVAFQVDQIATAAEQQTAATAEISNNIHLISQVVQQNSSSTRSSAEATVQLEKLARTLHELVGQFKIA